MGQWYDNSQLSRQTFHKINHLKKKKDDLVGKKLWDEHYLFCYAMAVSVRAAASASAAKHLCRVAGPLAAPLPPGCKLGPHRGIERHDLVVLLHHATHPHYVGPGHGAHHWVDLAHIVGVIHG
jgi:hypothetical protein